MSGESGRGGEREVKKGSEVRRSWLRVTGAAGAVKVLREGRGDDLRSGARAALEQIGPGG